MYIGTLKRQDLNAGLFEKSHLLNDRYLAANCKNPFEGSYVYGSKSSNCSNASLALTGIMI
jgi:hypothetical protein